MASAYFVGSLTGLARSLNQRIELVQKALHIVQGLGDVLRLVLVLAEVAVRGFGHPVEAEKIPVTGLGSEVAGHPSQVVEGKRRQRTWQR